MTLTVGETARGFALVEFTDRYGVRCSLQKSSLATEDAVWLGCFEPDPKINHCDGEGWVSYPLPDNVTTNTRMHLTREQVAELLPLLHRFVDTGDLR